MAESRTATKEELSLAVSLLSTASHSGQAVISDNDGGGFDIAIATLDGKMIIFSIRDAHLFAHEDEASPVE